LQNWPVGCKVRADLSERVFRLRLDFAMISFLNYNHKIKSYDYIVKCNLVVVV
jgi:hypothetical protein